MIVKREGENKKMISFAFYIRIETFIFFAEFPAVLAAVRSWIAVGAAVHGPL